MYYFSTVNQVALSFSDIEVDEEKGERIYLHFERPNNNGFDFIDMVSPTLHIQRSFGFSDNECLRLKRYAKNNERHIWELSRAKGDIENA